MAGGVADAADEGQRATDSEVSATLTVVIVRLDRTIQYSRDADDPWRGRGVLPAFAGM